MRNVPRWRGLKHFDHVTTIDFSDGQAFFDILKVSFAALQQFDSSQSGAANSFLHGPAFTQELAHGALHSGLPMPPPHA